MKPVRIIMVTIGLALMLIAFGYYATGPRYNGVTAEKWLDEACRSMRSRPAAILGTVLPRADQHAVALEEPVEAFRHMGNRGISCLIDAYVEQTRAYPKWYERLALKAKRYLRSPFIRPSGSALLSGAAVIRTRGLAFRSKVAYWLILRVGPGAIPEVIRRTQAADTETRARLLTLLGEFGPGNPQSQACLFQMLADPSPRVVYGVLEVLWMTEPEPTSAIPKIIPFLNNANIRVRVEASYSLGSLAPIPASLLQPLVKALSDNDGTVRVNAARAIGLSDTSSEEVFSSLVGLLEDSNPVTRFRAAEALVRLLGPHALRQEPLLSQVISEAELSSNNYFRLVGFNAQTALGKEEVSDPATVNMFRRLLVNHCAYVRTEALTGLMFSLEKSASSIPPEIETLLRAAEHDHNGFVRFQARSILDRWGNLSEQEFEPPRDF